MSAAPTVYSIRGNPTSVANPSSSAITPEHATEIITYALAHSYTETALKYPVEVLEYGSDLVAMVEGELDHSPSQIERFREMVSLLRRGHTLTNLLDSYPDIVLNGAYDLIHLDKWLKQGIFPN
jgi:hypothetical protein